MFNPLEDFNYFIQKKMTVLLCKVILFLITDSHLFVIRNIKYFRCNHFLSSLHDIIFMLLKLKGLNTCED